MILTTHYMEEAEHLADRVGIIARGQLLAIGTPAELTSGRTGVRFKSSEGIDVALLGEKLGCAVTLESEGSYSLDVDGTPFLIANLTAWAATRDILLTEVRVGARGLEEVFLELTEDSE